MVGVVKTGGGHAAIVSKCYALNVPFSSLAVEQHRAFVPGTLSCSKTMSNFENRANGRNFVTYDLDAVQFVTSIGRKSPWYGNVKTGKGPYSFKAARGSQIWGAFARMTVGEALKS